MNPEETETRISESCNRSLKAALHKNSVEQTNCDSTTRILDAQRKCAYSRLTREEKDVRQQLQLLQLEQKQLSDLATGTACGSDPSSPLQESDLSLIPDQRSVVPDEVVNPYPITSRSKTNSGPNTQQDPNTVGSSSLSSTRCLTRDPNDLETTSPRPWPGDLEAISSIRRALKPPCRQRIDQQQQQQQQSASSNSWARSRSLKERPQSSALTRLHAMLRSKSLRGPDKARPSLSSPSASPIDSSGGTCSRSGSLKDRPKRQFQRRIGDDAPGAVPGHGQLRRSVSLKTKMSEPDYGGSREEERRAAAPPPRLDRLGGLC